MRRVYPGFYGLTQSQVPSPPNKSNGLLGQLRWLIAVMDDDKESGIKFVAGCLAYLIERGCITAKQDLILKSIFMETVKLWNDEALICQMTPDDDDSLYHSETQGNA